jgi:peptidoglycan hydrolase CwlO-like protein
MKRTIAILALAAGATFAQQPMLASDRVADMRTQLTPEQQRFNDLITGVSQQRNDAMNQVASLNAELAKIVRERDEALKKAAECKPKDK